MEQVLLVGEFQIHTPCYCPSLIYSPKTFLSVTGHHLAPMSNLYVWLIDAMWKIYVIYCKVVVKTFPQYMAPTKRRAYALKLVPFP